MPPIEQGCIDIWIDEIVPCLKDTETGEIKETVVFKIESRTYLKKLQQSNGWHINWNETPKNVEVYPSYYEQPNPYINAPSCHVNLLELSRYAKKCGKKIIELTQEEVKNFSL